MFSEDITNRTTLNEVSPFALTADPGPVVECHNNICCLCVRPLNQTN